MLPPQGLKQHHAVQPGQQLGPEGLLHRGHHPLLCQGRALLPHKSAAFGAHRLAAQIGGEDHHRVPKAHRLAGAVGKLTLLQHLQQQVEHLRVGLFHLVQQHHRRRLRLDPLGELPALSVAHIARR